MMDRIQAEREAREHIVTGAWEKAVDLYRELLEAKGADPNIYNLIGDVYAKVDNLEDAIPEYLSAIDVYETEGLFENGIAVCKKILRLSPESGNVYFRLAFFYAEIGLLSEAKESLINYMKCSEDNTVAKENPQKYKKLMILLSSDERLKPDVQVAYVKIGQQERELDALFGMASLEPDQSLESKSIPKSEETSKDAVAEETVLSPDKPEKQVAPEGEISVGQTEQATQGSPEVDSVSSDSGQKPAAKPLPQQKAVPPSDKPEKQVAPEGEISVGQTEQATQGSPEVDSVSSDSGQKPAAKPLPQQKAVPPSDKPEKQMAPEGEISVGQTEQVTQGSPEVESVSSDSGQKPAAKPLPQQKAVPPSDKPEKQMAPEGEISVGQTEQVTQGSPEVESVSSDSGQKPVAKPLPQQKAVPPSDKPEKQVAPEGEISVGQTEQVTQGSPEVESVSSDSGQKPVAESLPQQKAVPPSDKPEKQVAPEGEISVGQTEQATQGSPEVESVSSDSGQKPVAESLPQQETEEVDKNIRLPRDEEEVQLFLHAIEEVKASNSSSASKDHYKVGLQYKQLGFYDAAVREFQLSSNAGQKRLESLKEVGSCFLEKNQADVAISAFKRAIEESGKGGKDYVALRYGIGKAYELLKEEEKAIEAFEDICLHDIGYLDVKERLVRLRGE